jgi:carbon monoxide dehydrogenase subunit G
MKHISKSLEINAPAERIFDFINTPANFLTVWPSMSEVSNVQRAADGRQTWDWVYKMVGFPFKGHSKTTDMEKPTRLTVENAGGIPSTLRWTLQKSGSGVKLTLDIDYEIPAPVVGKLAEAVVSRLNEHEATNLLANIKATMELSPSANASQETRART